MKTANLCETLPCVKVKYLRYGRTRQLSLFQKSHPPAVDKLRPVSLTAQLAKVAELFVSKWLIADRPSLDPRQFGCQKGQSTAHYLVNSVNFLCRESERPQNMSTLVFTDFSKAFDRIDHTVAIQKLISIGARTTLILWVCDFLSLRCQRVRYGAQLSDWETLTCSVPQGTLLGPLIFLVVFDDAMRNATAERWKYVDDLSLAESRRCTTPSSMQTEFQ